MALADLCLRKGCRSMRDVCRSTVLLFCLWVLNLSPSLVPPKPPKVIRNVSFFMEPRFWESAVMQRLARVEAASFASMANSRHNEASLGYGRLDAQDLQSNASSAAAFENAAGLLRCGSGSW